MGLLKNLYQAFFVLCGEFFLTLSSQKASFQKTQNSETSPEASMTDHNSEKIGYPDDKGRTFEEALEQGDPIAQFRLAFMYEKGQGVKKDRSEARRLFTLAAEQGYSLAQSRLGWMYKSGFGARKNFKIALKWFLKGVAQNDALSQYCLGSMYEAGEGVQESVSEAKNFIGWLPTRGWL